MLNKFMFDDTSFMKNAYRDSANKGEFVKDSTYLNIIDHEVMHLKSMKNKARKLFKKFIEKNDKKGYNLKELIEKNISRYASKVNYLTNEFVELASELNVLKIIDNDKFNKLLEE